MTGRMARQYVTWRRLPRCWAVFSWRSISLRYEADMVKRMQHIGTFLHNEMGISLRGISPMCGRSSIHLQKIFFLRSIEASLMRSAKALERLCFVLAITTLYLVSVGTLVVKKGKRRLVDPHWFRGAS